MIGTTHNTAIKGLFDYIDPNSELAKYLESEGYKKQDGLLMLLTMKVVLTGISFRESKLHRTHRAIFFRFPLRQSANQKEK